MKNILLASLLLVSVNAHAGFLTGAAVGYALASDKKPSPVSNSDTIVSDHDVIICEQYSDTQYCHVTTSALYGSIVCPDGNLYDHCLTPEQYAGDYGYKTIYKRGVHFTEYHTYILMEVSK